MKSPQEWMQQAIELAIRNVETGGGGPFAALVVRDGELVATGANAVTATNDPTAHAEIQAIRAACQELDSFQLDDCELFTSCEPCPMCLGAIYWARPKRFYFACTRADAALAGFDDAHIYDEILLEPGERTIVGSELLREAGLRAFNAWRKSSHKVAY